MKELFTYMFNDNKFLQKYFIYTIFLYIYSVFLFFQKYFILNKNIEGSICFFVLLVFTAFILSGYLVKCVKALSIQNENYLLPFLNIWSCIKTGFKFTLSFIIIGIIWGILCFIPVVNIIAFVSILIFVIYFSLAYTWIFAQTEKINSFLRIIKAFDIIAFDKNNYFISFILSIFVSFLAFICNLFLSFLINIFVKNIILTYFILSLFNSFVLSYVFFINSLIIAKSIKPECVEMLK